MNDIQEYCGEGNISDCMDKVRGLLGEAGTLMAALMKMPLAEPDDPSWDDFERKPHIHELAEVYCAIYDAEKLTKKTLSEIKGEKVNP